jgi:DNA primase
VKKVEGLIPPLYVPNWKRVLDSDTVFVVYGIIDAWAFEDLGLPCVTGITGKSLSYKHLKEFDKRFVIVPDKYEEDAAEHLANKTGWRATVKRLKWPPECKDPDEIRVKVGIKALATAIGL